MTRRTKRKSRFVAVAVVGVALVAASCALFACAPQKNPGIATIKAVAPTTIPTADEFGVITAESWADQYPNEYQSYLKNAQNVPYNYSAETAKDADKTSVGTEALKGDFSAEKNKVSFLDTNPEIKTICLGYGYAKFYTEPAGHTYSLYTVEHNGRVGEKTKVSCYACKTPQYNFAEQAALAAGKTDFYKQPFTGNGFTENISCANCHENENPTQLKVTRLNWVKSMGDDASKIPLESQVCGQCHCDYSMSPTTGEPTSPYTGGIASMDPDKALKFYDDNNYADWTYESTGAKMISVRHAEFEFMYVDGGTHMTELGYNCASCHMGTEVDANGNGYSNHNLTSPLENEQLIKNNCSSCHKDIKAEVKAIQQDIDGRTTALGKRCESFIKNFENALSAGTVSDADKAQLQYVQRAACYYWNLAAAENSEGAHNPTLYNRILKESNEWLDKGDALLGVSSQA